MAKQSVRVKINSAGVVALLTDAKVSADLEQRGQRIAAAAGEGFEVDVTRNSDRAVAFVRAATTEARLAEAEDRALTRAVDAGR
ncbi:hypothetical protein IT882_13110 [Microbacterium schleiferi]|uniref:Uncharacterized protein n=2 Tax=Microbacterium schleiferi TaxID=69362 RepID=A0A7S8MVR2_9MICO|nr:hypothetical protein IT882_13110 [Microbacterium schleiferi]